MKQKTINHKNQGKIQKKPLLIGLEQKYLHEEGGKWQIRFYVSKAADFYRRMDILSMLIARESPNYQGQSINLQMSPEDFPSEVRVTILMHYTGIREKSSIVESLLRRHGESLVEKIEKLIA